MLLMSYAQNTKCGPMVVFYWILTIPGISLIVYKENNRHKTSQRNFLRGSGLEFINDQCTTEEQYISAQRTVKVSTADW